MFTVFLRVSKSDSLANHSHSGVSADACRYSRRRWAVCYIVCRDIHGQFYDLCNIFDKKGFPSQDKQYLFNGDFVDRGSFSVETIFTLFALKCACPLWIHLARGNHESRSLNEVHGFENRGGATEGKAHVLNRKIIVLHGGLFSRDGVTLSDIKSIQRFCQPPKRGLMRDLLWSDPQDSPGRSRSTRGEDIIFFDLLVRSHELKDKGYEISHNGKFITVFSAPNYCDRENNKGAFIVFKAPQMEPDIQTFSVVRHPYRMWSQWPIAD
ncbi:hypothetical protein F2Q70_00007631 [Brassica cretica]|uniref:Serine/threonine specific protein phosphatases domain-containing protein n=1 Tax=Brassica cretica TaxID=69181 RepID=A0A8S9LWB5_BRACR|nr:hypothetical protein F2Q68_00000666 [Brassica cretica]KAF2610139.1 hypothetical protein F2Q70_00007631 [Brassica cretica]